MIEISFNRQSVCMGDDIKNGFYKMSFQDDDELRDLIRCIVRGGNGNTWPIPGTTNEDWQVESNIGDIAILHADDKGEWICSYLKPFSADALLKECGIERIYACRKK